MICTRRFPLPALFALLLLSCSPKPAEILLDTKATDAHTLMGLVREHQDRLRSVVGRGTVTFESPEVAGSAAFELALKRPDSLLVTFEGPFGIDLGTLFVSREKYLMYSSMENRVVTGVPTTAAIRSFIPFDLTLDQVIGAFSGAFPFPSESLETYTVDENMFLLSFACGNKHCKYWVDNRYLLVRRYEMRDDHDNLIMDATTSSFADDGSTYAPKHIRIRFPSQDRQLSVSYSSITVNDPRPSFAYTIPSNARTIVR